MDKVESESAAAGRKLKLVLLKCDLTAADTLGIIYVVIQYVQYTAAGTVY
jgi:hypothetical protein